MEKLKITSTRLQALALVFIILTPCAVALSVGTGSWTDLLVIPQNMALDATQISGGHLLAVLAVSSIQPIVYMLTFYLLYRLLGLYRRGIIFTAENVAAIRRIGWALVSIDIAEVVQTMITGPILALFHITPGYFIVELDGRFVIMGFFIVLIAYVMDMGRELKEQDNLVI